MKLFITNRDYFEEFFNDENRRNSIRNYYTAKEIHKLAFTELSKSIDINHVIPVILTPNYDDVGEGICIFEFETKRGDIYYYTYTGTAS